MPSSIIWGREGRWAVHPGLGTSGPWWPASGNEVGEGWKGGGVITMRWSRKEACGQPLHPWNLCMLTRQPIHTFPSWLMSNANMKELRLKYCDLRKDLFSSEPPLTWRSSGSAAHQSAKRMWWKRKRQDHSVKDIEPKQTFKGQRKLVLTPHRKMIWITSHQALPHLILHLNPTAFCMVLSGFLQWGHGSEKEWRAWGWINQEGVELERDTQPSCLHITGTIDDHQDQGSVKKSLCPLKELVAGPCFQNAKLPLTVLQPSDNIPHGHGNAIPPKEPTSDHLF